MSEMSNTSPASLSMDHVCPATRLLEKRRLMFEVQESLDKQQEIFAKQQVRFFFFLARFILERELLPLKKNYNRKHFDFERRIYENMI